LTSPEEASSVSAILVYTIAVVPNHEHFLLPGFASSYGSAKTSAFDASILPNQNPPPRVPRQASFDLPARLLTFRRLDGNVPDNHFVGRLDSVVSPYAIKDKVPQPVLLATKYAGTTPSEPFSFSLGGWKNTEAQMIVLGYIDRCAESAN